VVGLPIYPFRLSKDSHMLESCASKRVGVADQLV